MPHADAFDVMVRLSEAIPSTMVHDIEELDVQKSHVVVRGIVGSIPDAQSIVSALAEKPCFSDVKIKSTTQAVGSDRQKYVMEFDLKCPEDVHKASKKKDDASPSAPAAEANKMAGPLLRMNERERKLVGDSRLSSAAVVVLAAVPFGLDLYVRSARADNDDLRQALADVQDARGRIRERQARKDMVTARYAQTAPPLAGFLEQTARVQKLEVTESNPLPDIPHGKRFTEHGTNVHLKKAGMLPVAKFLEAIERSGYARGGDAPQHPQARRRGRLVRRRGGRIVVRPRRGAAGACGECQAVKERWIKLAKDHGGLVGYPIFYLVCIVVFASLTFPYDALRARIVASYNAGQRDTGGLRELQIDSMSGYFSPASGCTESPSPRDRPRSATTRPSCRSTTRPRDTRSSRRSSGAAASTSASPRSAERPAVRTASMATIGRSTRPSTRWTSARSGAVRVFRCAGRREARRHHPSEAARWKDGQGLGADRARGQGLRARRRQGEAHGRAGGAAD